MKVLMSGRSKHDDRVLMNLQRADMPYICLIVSIDFPIIVCLCGSTRFREEYAKVNEEETLSGKIVLSCGCYDKEVSEETKTALDELHKRKIDLADEVLVINVDGYIGNSTRSEIEYAQRTGKPVRYRYDQGS